MHILKCGVGVVAQQEGGGEAHRSSIEQRSIKDAEWVKDLTGDKRKKRKRPAHNSSIRLSDSESDIEEVLSSSAPSLASSRELFVGLTSSAICYVTARSSSWQLLFSGERILPAKADGAPIQGCTVQCGPANKRCQTGPSTQS